jgi:hypothetical protein
MVDAAADSADSAGDAGDVSGGPDAADARMPDAEEDQAPAEVQADAADTTGDAVGPGCTLVSQGALLGKEDEPDKFQLSLFHFNIQYVAGGLEGFLDKEELHLNEAEVEDRIVTESLDPLLSVLEKHPTWGFDVELQGYMLDVMRQRHPESLERMRKLVEKGQLHVDSFHYSDQLWVAHPITSMQKSWELTAEAFASVCLPLGRAVFSQEGQFGEGLASYARDWNRVALFPTNLFKYFYGPMPGKLMYDYGGGAVVIAGRGAVEEFNGRKVEMEWHFMNDGELACTGNGNPYFGTAFQYDVAFTKAWVDELEEKEKEGWRISTVAEYVDKLEDYGYAAEPLPAIGDGTWQAGETANVHRWMGLTGGFGETEDDNGVLTAVTRSRIALQAAAVLAAQMKADGQAGWEEAEETVHGGWREQMLSECSDTTGWNPWKGEVDYGFKHSGLALAAAVEVLGPQIGSGLLVDTMAGGVTRALPTLYYVLEGAGPSLSVKTTGTALEQAPVAVDVVADGWKVAQTWEALSAGLSALTLTFAPAGDVAECSRTVQVAFERSGDVVEFVPAGLEDKGSTAALDVGTLTLDDTQALTLPLANGLVGVGGKRWVVSVNARNHVAAVVPKAEQKVVLDNRSQPLPKEQGEGFTWMFLVLEGAEAGSAVSLANSVNVRPVVRLGGQ